MKNMKNKHLQTNTLEEINRSDRFYTSGNPVQDDILVQCISESYHNRRPTNITPENNKTRRPKHCHKRVNRS
jgi:hypothetical protein